MNEAIHPNLIRYRCHRGMLELDLILLAFFDKYFDTLSQPQRQQFANLLECTDPELMSWLLGEQQPKDGELQALVEQIKAAT